MLTVLFCHIPAAFPEQRFKEYLNLLPENHQNHVTKFRYSKDRNLRLFGKLLLLEGVKKYGYTEALLSRIKYTPFNKPYLDTDLSFNITHSGNMVLCALSDSYELGIDVEAIKPISKEDFSGVWTKSEHSLIMKDEKYNWFYRLWTRKEAVIKADGKGLSIPLKSINVLGNTAVVGNRIWHITELKIDANYSVHIATDKALSTPLKPEEVLFN
ncbi:4'-phosphopantetheinyl transferase family protein [Maribacter sp. 2-571]|uniref:4'-phosphopantetheinyl transferase family protein n=1 Tax=Maribacter sp. 2-571 TaxID=3417569 RepID=UPI003D34DC38